MTEIKAGIDGTIYGLNSNHVLYAYTEASGWVESAATLQTAGNQAILHISVGSASEVIAQTAITGPNIYVLNSAGTAWSSLSGGGICTDTEISADGDLWCIDMSGTVPFHYINGVWTEINGKYATNIAVAENGVAYIVNSSNQLEVWNGSG